MVDSMIYIPDKADLCTVGRYLLCPLARLAIYGSFMFTGGKNTHAFAAHVSVYSSAPPTTCSDC